MRFFQTQGLLHRLLHIPFRTAFFVSLPLIALAGWLTLNAWLDYNRFVGHVSGGKLVPAFTSEMLHWFARDNLHRAKLRLTAPPMPIDDALETVQLSIDSESLLELNKDLPRSGKDQEFRAFVRYRGKTHKVKARYTGDNYWHWLPTQKSWRISTKKKKLIDGSRKLNVKNPRNAITFNEVIAMDLARDLGLIAPRMKPVKFIQNSIYMGVYLFGDKIDESVVRRLGRMPGSIYSGDGALPDPVSGVSTLFTCAECWPKNASRNAQQSGFRGDIELFLRGVNSPTSLEFFRFAEDYLDKERYSRYVALDNVLASGHHDYNHNHKFYFDPFLGKFEPIAWDLDSWHTPDPNLDYTGNPLLNAWKLIPEYELLRQKQVYRLTREDALLSAQQLHSRIDRYAALIRPALEADVYRDTKSYAGITKLKMAGVPLTTFSLDEFDRQVRNLKNGVNTRSETLQNFLDVSTLTFAVNSDSQHTRLDLIADGNVGRAITAITVAGLPNGTLLRRDSNLNGILDNEDQMIAVSSEGRFELDEVALPGYRRVEAIRAFKYLFGDYDLAAAPLRYSYFLTSPDVSIDTVVIESSNILTGSPKEAFIAAAPERIDFSATVSLHPWQIAEEPEPRVVQLGPGVVELKETLFVAPTETLRIAAGTTLRLAPDVSIFSEGPVHLEGTADQPVYVEAQVAGEPWGVLAAYGDRANGSSISFAQVTGGSVLTHKLVYYSGAVSFHGVSDISITDSRFGDNSIGDDTVHIGYSDSFVIERSEFYGGLSDALDIDISTGSISSSYFHDNGNDGVDLMTSTVDIDSSWMADNGDKGISVGENSTLRLDETVLEANLIGVEIKDQSQVFYGNNLLLDSPTGVNLYKKNWRYDDGGRISGNALVSFDVVTVLSKDKHSETDVTQQVLANRMLADDYRNARLTSLREKFTGVLFSQ